MSADEFKYDASSIEKNQDETGVHVIADRKHKLDVVSIDLVQRRLKQRHIQMYVYLAFAFLPHPPHLFFRIAVCRVTVLPPA